MRSRRACWANLAGRVSEHRKRHLIAYDSAVSIGAATKGRSPSAELLKECRLAYPFILAADAVEGALWVESEENVADHGSRGRKMPMPAPRRAWVDAFFQGDLSAIDDRLDHSSTRRVDSTRSYPG